MTSTFLHADKHISEDEAAEDIPPPRCEVCGAITWLLRVSEKANDAGTVKTRAYECKSCGEQTEIVSTDAEPSAGGPLV